MIPQTLKWAGDVDGFLELIDQRLLPGKFCKLQCRDIESAFDAIKTLAVRGAPAIGVAAAYGLVLGMQQLSADATLQQGLEKLTESSQYLTSSRPTAVNLFWAIQRIEQKAVDFAQSSPSASIHTLREMILHEADAICSEDVDMCQRIGQNGEKFIKDDSSLLTHCNAGALATAGQGTALSVMFEAHKKGKRFKVYADETRPLLQGGRLTAWELQQAGIETIVICDNMAGWLMKQGKINTCFVGADRIAANGDAANKIGTYSLSVLAKEHNVPFYIAAPSSTFDLELDSGSRIPIEQRASDEIRFIGDKVITPEGVGVYNPAFDVTPVEYITSIITEKGVIEKPNKMKIAELFSA